MLKDDFKKLKVFWKIVWWINLVWCIPIGVLLILPPLTKLEMIAAACNIFNIAAAHWWLNFLDKEMEALDDK